MKYTIKMFRNTSPGNNKANVKVTFNNSFDVSGIHVREGEKGLFITMPSYKTNKGEFKSIANPTTAGFRKQLYSDILSAYDYLDKHEDAKSFIKDCEYETDKPSKNTISTYRVKNPDNPTLAMANINIDGQFSINNIQIKEGEYGLYTIMPSYKKADGRYVHIAAPTDDCKKTCNKDILTTYDNMVKQNFDSIHCDYLGIGEETKTPNNIANYTESLQHENGGFEEISPDDDLPFDD